MAPKKKVKKVKSLPAKSLSGKHATGIKGGGGLPVKMKEFHR